MARVQVVGIDVTVAWMLSRAIPTIRRGRRFLSSYATGSSREDSKTTCCCRQHKKMFRPACFLKISGYVHTAVLVYDRKQKRVERMHIFELIPTPNPPRIQKEREKAINYVPFSRWPLVPASSAPLDIAC